MIPGIVAVALRTPTNFVRSITEALAANTSAVSSVTTPVTAEAGSVVLYTGTGAAQSITGAGLQPDLVILKDRSTGGWRWVNATRGVSNYQDSSSFTVETTDAQGITSLDTDGFSLGTSSAFNQAAHTYAAFTMKEVSGAFDIVTYAGSGSNATQAHGLGVVPELIIIGSYDDTKNWAVYPGPLADPSKFLNLNFTSAAGTSTTLWNNTAPTSSVFSLGGAANVNQSGDGYTAFLFASVTGKTKVGTYTGTGASGNAIATGFRPKWVLIRRTDSTGDWLMVDETRDATAPSTASLALNTTSAESTSAVSVTFSGTGFEPTAPNVSGGTYLYLAVA